MNPEEKAAFALGVEEGFCRVLKILDLRTRQAEDDRCAAVGDYQRDLARSRVGAFEILTTELEKKVKRRRK